MYLDDQVSKVSQVSQEALDVQGLTAPREIEETPVSEANLDHKVSPDPEGILVFPGLQDRLLMEAGGRVVSPGVLEQRACPERSWEPHLVPQDRTVYQESQETRVSRGRQEDLDYQVATDASAFPD